MSFLLELFGTEKPIIGLVHIQPLPGILFIEGKEWTRLSSGRRPICKPCRTEAAFTRCLFTGVWAGDFGMVDRDIAVTLRLKNAYRLDDL